MKATTFRLSLCSLLIFAITAKPYLPLGKLTNEEIQEMMLKHDAEKLRVRVELRPQDMNQGVNVWKSVVAEQNGPPLTAEEDREEVDMDPVFSRVQSQEPELDWDQVYHKHSEELLQYLTPLGADSKSDAEVRVAYSEPEKDEDDVYHGDNQYSEVQTESEQKIKEDSTVRVYLQPEEDKDDLYHKTSSSFSKATQKLLLPLMNHPKGSTANPRKTWMISTTSDPSKNKPPQKDKTKKARSQRLHQANKSEGPLQESLE